MPRPSTIALENEDGSIRQVNLTWTFVDPEPMARFLKEHYSDVNKLKSLLEQGNICTLGQEIGEPHNIDDMSVLEQNPTWSRFYARDGGALNATAVDFTTFNEYMAEIHEAEYHFILRLVGEDRVWYYGKENDPLQLIEPLLEDKKWNPFQDISPPSNLLDTSPPTM